MSALSRFEHFMEEMVEGSVARFFRSPVQPAEIAKRLERAMESNQSIGVKRIVVPSFYRAFLNPRDFAAFQPVRAQLEEEMATYLSELAAERNFTMLEHPRVELGSDQSVSQRSIQVVAEMASSAGPNSTQVMPAQVMPSQPRSHAILLLQAPTGPKVIPVESTLVTLGRGLGNDIILEDTRVSRHHAQLSYRNRRFWLTDLGSTNGTFVNGERINEASLRSGDACSLGGLELVFRES
jgi:hypothetical protein